MMKRVIACVVVMVMAMPVVPAFSQTSAVGPSGTSTAVVDSSLEFSMNRCERESVVRLREAGSGDGFDREVSLHEGHVLLLRPYVGLDLGSCLQDHRDRDTDDQHVDG
jgi:hypothetical protein